MLEALSEFRRRLAGAAAGRPGARGRRDLRPPCGGDQAGNLVPVFFGSAESDHGITRLLKVLRHEAPGIDATRERTGIDADGEAVARVFKTSHGSQTGKRSIARVLRGDVEDGATLGGSRVSGIVKLRGADQEKVAKLAEGEAGALGRRRRCVREICCRRRAMPRVRRGRRRRSPSMRWHPCGPAGRRGEDGRRTGTAHRRGSVTDLRPESGYGEFVLRGQGETHLRIALERMHNRNKLEVDGGLPQVAYKESIKKPSRSMRGTRSSREGTASSATSISKSNRCREVRGSNSPTRSPAAWCPSSTSRRSENGVKEYLSQDRSDFPWSMSRSS